MEKPLIFECNDPTKLINYKKVQPEASSSEIGRDRLLFSNDEHKHFEIVFEFNCSYQFLGATVCCQGANQGQIKESLKKIYCPLPFP